MINFCILHFFLSKFRKIFNFCANLCLCYWNCLCICHLRGFFYHLLLGSVPTVSEGVVSSTACINQVTSCTSTITTIDKYKLFKHHHHHDRHVQVGEGKFEPILEQDRECCVGELDIGVRNCSSWVAYRCSPTTLIGQLLSLELFFTGWFQRLPATWATVLVREFLVPRVLPAPMATHHVTVSGLLFWFSSLPYLDKKLCKAEIRALRRSKITDLYQKCFPQSQSSLKMFCWLSRPTTWSLRWCRPGRRSSLNHDLHNPRLSSTACLFFKMWSSPRASISTSSGSQTARIFCRRFHCFHFI